MRIAAVVLGSILFLELLFRLFEPHLSPARGQAIVRELRGIERAGYSTGEFEDGVPVSEVETAAYYLYRNKPLSKLHGFQQHNSQGHRGPEIGEKQRGEIRILAVGGSTTYGAFLKNPNEAWPKQLERLLQEKFPAQRIQVINAGLPGATSAEALVAYELRDRYLGADIAILHQGYNDSEPPLFGDYRPDYSTYRNIGPRTAEIRPGERYFLKLALARTLYSWWLRHRRPATIESPSLGLVDPNRLIENARRNSPLGFERNTQMLVRMLLEDGTKPIFFPGFQAPREVYALLPDNRKRAERYHEAIAISLSKNTAVMKSLASRHHITYWELPAGLIPLTHFLDDCHLSAEGELIKARFLAERLIPILTTIARGKK